MKSISILIIELLVLTSGLSRSYASSGGWVGNAPIASYTPTIAFQNYYSEGTEAKEWNSILLPQGQSRIGFQLNYCNTCFTNTHWGVGYNYGFTPKLTMLDLLSFGYSLKSSNGIGHELAFIFGLTDGVLNSSDFGTSVGPGVGLAYAYSEADWRFDLTTLVSGYYNIDNKYWASFKVTTTGSLTKWFNENWGSGLSLTYLHHSHYSKTISCGPNCTSTNDAYDFNDFTDPKIYALLRLNNVHEFELGLRHSVGNDRDITSLGYAYKW